MAGSDERWEDTRKAWTDVGERFSELGRMLGERFKETEPAARDTSGSALNDAVRGVIAQLDRAFTSVGETFRDPDAKQRLREAAGRLGGALQTTFDEAGESLRARREGSGGSNPKDSGGSAGA